MACRMIGADAGAMGAADAVGATKGSCGAEAEAHDGARSVNVRTALRTDRCLSMACLHRKKQQHMTVIIRTTKMMASPWPRAGLPLTVKKWKPEASL